MHPFVCDIVHFPKECYCYKAKQFEVCSNCVEKRYNLNYRCPKFCLTVLPDYVKEEAMSINYYLDDKLKAAPFLF